jgi:predicted phosphodiesterase
MKIAILGDSHFGMRNDSLHFHKYYQKFYNDVFFPYLIENGINEIYQLGDLFDRRKYINFNSLYLSRKYFFDVLKSNNLKMTTLLGNHDITYRNTLQVNSSELLLKDYDNIQVIHNPTTIELNGVLIDLIPWICAENEQKIFEYIEKSKAEICFGHFEIAGFEMDRGNVCHEGMDRNHLRRYDIVLSGHFHHKSTDGQIYYTGTPGEITWSDYDDPRGFHIFDTETRELEFIQNPYRMFYRIEYDDSKQSFEYWKDFDYSQFNEKYVKILIVTKNNPYCFDTVLDKLLKENPIDVCVVENFEELEHIDDDAVNQAEDTVTILSKYIDQLTLNVDKDKLKNVMRELYIECLSVDQDG